MDQLFMIEVLVDTIYFSKLPVPPKKQIIVTATFGNFASLEIRTDVMGALETQERDSKRRDIDIGCGRSYLFPFQATNLISALEKCPLEISLTTKLDPKPIGMVKIPWNDDFIDMVKSSVDSAGYITPVANKNSFQLRSGNTVTADIEIFVRLSCFGDSIATQYQVIEPKSAADGAPGSAAKQFLFKNINYATMFQCEKYGYGSENDIVPVGPVFHAINADAMERSAAPINQFFNQSFSVIGGTDESRRQSVFGADFANSFMRSFQQLPHDPRMLSQMSTMSTLSTAHQALLGREQNKLFMNLRQLLGNASMMSGMLSFAGDQDGQSEHSIGVENLEDETANLHEELTVAQIEKMLCKNKNCPAAIKFKEFGIGPLATGKGIGTLWKTVEAPVTYGMSQMNGKFSRYGPLGTYSKPKDPKDPFIAKAISQTGTIKRDVSGGFVPGKRSSIDSQSKSISQKSSGSVKKCQGSVKSNTSSSASTDKPCFRLSGGRDKSDLKTITKRTRGKVSSRVDSNSKTRCTCTSLRLRGGCLLGENDYTPLRLKGGSPIGGDDMPNPVNACQELLNEYNKLLSEYKSALGPCGQATCPFSPALINESCKKTCYPSQPCPGSNHSKPKRNSSNQRGSQNEGSLKRGSENSENIDPDMYPIIEMNCENTEPMGETEVAACSLPSCPYKREMTTTVEQQFKNAQIPPGCGSPTCPYTKKKLMDDFDEDLQIQMDELPHKCGGIDCPFDMPDDLPPIHWDCPEPLPKGRCKNPKCPLSKKDDLLDKYFPKADSPCHSPTCPFTVAPCTFPGCPFANMDPCPPTCPYAKPEMSPMDCSPSFCPFLPPKPEDICSNPDCPFQIEKVEDNDSQCDNPDCAFKKKLFNEMEECTPTTCKSFGGDLECCECGAGDDNVSDNECPCNSRSSGGDKPAKPISSRNMKSSTGHVVVEEPITKIEITPEDILDRKNTDASKSSLKHGSSARIQKKRRKRKKKSKYIYSEGDKYPGIKVGHKDCIMPKFNVPYNMGWLWNVHTSYGLSPRRGWKPGAIGRTLANRIREHRIKMGFLPLIPKPLPPSKKRKKRGGGGYDGSSSEEDIPLKPTLQIKKKDGCFYITMNPLKDPKTLEDNENPYMDCTPMQFKITKNKDKKEDEGGFKTCYCGDDDAEDVSSTSSDSELDIEFTPPAGIIHPDRLRRKKNVVHIDTQYDINDCKPDTIQLEKKEGGKKGKGGKGKGKGGKGKGKKGKF